MYRISPLLIKQNEGCGPENKEELAIFENAKREVELAGIELKNSLDVVEVKMDPPTLDDTMPDVERFTRASPQIYESEACKDSLWSLSENFRMF